jgi:hypothetical protein
MESQYVHTYQALVTQWSEALSSAEYHLMLFINERTLRYGKTEESIPVRHFLEGVFNASGERIVAGVGHTKAAIIRAYQSLQEKGLIEITKGQRFNSTNIFVMQVGRILEGAKKLSKLKVPKKKKQAENDNQVVSYDNRSGVVEAPQWCRRDTSISTHYNNKRNSKNSNSADVTAGIAEALEKAKEKNAASAQRKVQTMATRGLSKQGVSALWRKLLVQYYPDATANLVVTPKQYGMLKASYEATNLPLPFPEFAEWAVANWQELIDYDFAWCKKSPPPRLPSLPFFASMLKYFANYHGNQHIRDTHRKVKSDDAAKKARKLSEQNERLKAELAASERGRTQEQARAEEFRKTAAKRKRELQSTAPQRMRPISELNFHEVPDLPEWGTEE